MFDDDSTREIRRSFRRILVFITSEWRRQFPRAGFLLKYIILCVLNVIDLEIVENYTLISFLFLYHCIIFYRLFGAGHFVVRLNHHHSNLFSTFVKRSFFLFFYFPSLNYVSFIRETIILTVAPAPVLGVFTLVNINLSLITI